MITNAMKQQFGRVCLWLGTAFLGFNIALWFVPGHLGIPPWLLGVGTAFMLLFVGTCIEQQLAWRRWNLSRQESTHTEA